MAVRYVALCRGVRGVGLYTGTIRLFLGLVWSGLEGRLQEVLRAVEALRVGGGSTGRQLSGFLRGEFGALPGSLVCGCVEGGYVGMGNGGYSVRAVLGRNSVLAFCVGSRFFRTSRRGGCRFVGTPGAFSVICRSRGLVLVSGGPNVVMRPSGGCRFSSLITEIRRCLCSGNRCGPSRRGTFTPTLIGEVSEGANKVIVTTGGTSDLEVLGTGVGAERLRGCCLYLLCKGPGESDSALRNCVAGGRDGGGIAIFGGRIRNSGRVGAGCRVLSFGNGFDLTRIRLLANEARRVETRVTSVKRPLINSAGCNGNGGTPSDVGCRTLCDCGLGFGFRASTNVLGCLGNGRFRMGSM